MEAQQFHLKWNNHSLNTLSSFQHLLDTNCLVDVSLTCSSGKVVPAHRMVLAACSDYFYRLFKDLPEKHPVIVFKDASEQILNDLLEFMYRGEVEVDEADLSDFLKFADTLQVKGLSQGDNGNPSWIPKEEVGDVSSSSKPATPSFPTTSTETTTVSNSGNTTPISVKENCKLIGSIPEPVTTLNKAYHFTSALASLQPNAAKFPNFFPGLHQATGAALEPTQAQDIYSHLASPNLFNALKRKYPVTFGQKHLPGFDPESPALKMPFLKDYFGKAPLPVDLSYGGLKEEDSDDIAEHSPPHHDLNENGTEDNASRNLENLNLNSNEKNINGQNARKPQGRGSRLERMIAAEYKILSEYSENTSNGTTTPETLPAITPELMKSRRTHSLQLAIGEILHNRASVQSAATKYHIPRETLRRHYQRYLKAMGIQKEETSPPVNRGAGQAVPVRHTPTTTKTVTSSFETLAAVAAAANATAANGEESSNYSSLLDIGQAYGIWNPNEDNSNDMNGPRDLKIVVDDDDEEENMFNEKESPEQLMIESQDTLEASTLTGNIEATNNNNIMPEKLLAAPRILPIETV